MYQARWCHFFVLVINHPFRYSVDSQHLVGESNRLRLYMIPLSERRFDMLARGYHRLMVFLRGWVCYATQLRVLCTSWALIERDVIVIVDSRCCVTDAVS